MWTWLDALPLRGGYADHAYYYRRYTGSAPFHTIADDAAVTFSSTLQFRTSIRIIHSGVTRKQ